jgi:hypothetical protein
MQFETIHKITPKCLKLFDANAHCHFSGAARSGPRRHLRHQDGPLAVRGAVKNAGAPATAAAATAATSAAAPRPDEFGTADLGAASGSGPHARLRPSSGVPAARAAASAAHQCAAAHHPPPSAHDGRPPAAADHPSPRPASHHGRHAPARTSSGPLASRRSGAPREPGILPTGV